MSITVTQKRRGRPATGESPQVGIRFSAFQLGAIESFAERRGLTRSEAARQLIEIGAAAVSDKANLLNRLDDWREQDERMTSRPSAIGILVDFGLENLAPLQSD